MNKGVLQSSPVQQMMATGNNPSWWNINNLMTRPPILAHHLGLGHNYNYDHDHDHEHDQYHQQLLLSSPSTTTSLLNCNSCSSSNNNNNNNNNENNNISITNNTNTNSLFQAHPYLNVNMSSTPSSSSWPNDHINLHHHHPSHLSESWSQYLMSGVCMGEEQDQVPKTKMERWEDQVVNNQLTNHITNHHQVKHEASASASMVGYGNTVAIANHDQKFQIGVLKNSNNSHNTNNNWSSPSQIMKNNNNNNNTNNNNNVTTSSPQSCVSTFSGSNCNSLLDFSSSKSSNESLHANHPAHDRSSECNSTANGGTHKKAKVQQSSTQSTFKVRKEKLGDRITALHQLVSPFGKTDTASVLLEAIGYIRFLQSQIEALSLPYLTSGVANKRQPHLVQGERNCMFPEDPGQLLNEHCLKRKGGPEQETHEEIKDLKSRGLCLVPVSCTLHVGSDNGADYWAPAFGGGFR